MSRVRFVIKGHTHQQKQWKQYDEKNCVFDGQVNKKPDKLKLPFVKKMIKKEFMNMAIEWDSINNMTNSKLQRIDYVTMSRDIVVQLISPLVNHENPILFFDSNAELQSNWKPRHTAYME